jgi:hypothetical protein
VQERVGGPTFTEPRERRGGGRRVASAWSAAALTADDLAARALSGFADLHAHPAVHGAFNGVAQPDESGAGAPDWSPMWSANPDGAVDSCWDLSSCATPGISDSANAYLLGNTGPIKTSYRLLQTGDGGPGTRKHQAGHWANDGDVGRVAHRNFVTQALSGLAGHGHLEQLTVPVEPDGSASVLQRADGWPNARDVIQ